MATYADENMSELELPMGFDDAPKTVQVEVLESKRSRELAAEIADELGLEEPRSGQLSKQHKALILLQLRDYRDIVNESD